MSEECCTFGPQSHKNDWLLSQGLLFYTSIYMNTSKTRINTFLCMKRSSVTSSLSLLQKCLTRPPLCAVVQKCRICAPLGAGAVIWPPTLSETTCGLALALGQHCVRHHLPQNDVALALDQQHCVHHLPQNKTSISDPYPPGRPIWLMCFFIISNLNFYDYHIIWNNLSITLADTTPDICHNHHNGNQN